MRDKDPCRQKKTKLSTIYQVLGCVLAITFLATILVIKGISFSSYKKSSSGSDAARVAKPILTITNSDYEEEMQAGSEATMTFTVSNSDQEKYSETALGYTIKIDKSSSENGDIVFTLKESNDSGNTYTQQVAEETNSLTYSSLTPLPAGAQATHYFQLEYTPSFENHNQSLFEINVEAKQVI